MVLLPLVGCSSTPPTTGGCWLLELVVEQPIEE
jgi:hypothetical protein